MIKFFFNKFSIVPYIVPAAILTCPLLSSSTFCIIKYPCAGSNNVMPQGGPLSPLLSNIMLNELDKELTKRGHRFVRYADDCMILCKSTKSAMRTLENIMPYIEGRLFLKVNREKTKVAHISKVKYLGYSFYRYRS